jgi:hypothetical protein
MSDYPKLAAEAGDRYLAVLAARQESFLNYVAAARTLAGPRPVLPIAASALATTQQLNEAQFEFAARLLAQQKRFFDALFTQPASAGTVMVKKPSVAKSKRPTQKVRAKKATSKKASTTRESLKAAPKSSNRVSEST